MAADAARLLRQRCLGSSPEDMARFRETLHDDLFRWTAPAQVDQATYSKQALAFLGGFFTVFCRTAAAGTQRLSRSEGLELIEALLSPKSS